MSLGQLNPPVPGERLQVTNFHHCLHIVMDAMKCTDAFRETFSRWVRVGRWEGVTWEDLSMEEFIMREENFHEGGAGYPSVVYCIISIKKVNIHVIQGCLQGKL